MRRSYCLGKCGIVIFREETIDQNEKAENYGHMNLLISKDPLACGKYK